MCPTPVEQGTYTLPPDPKRIPDDVKQEIERYVATGQINSDFVRAVLENDLIGSVQKADAENLSHLFDTCAYLFQCVPSDAIGSRQKVQAWIQFRINEADGKRFVKNLSRMNHV